MIAVIALLTAYIVIALRVVVDLFVQKYYVLVADVVFAMIVLNAVIAFIVVKMNVPANYAKYYC